MRAPPRWLAGVVILILIGLPSTTLAIRDDFPPDLMAPARFSMDFLEEGGTELVWTQTDGYRESSIATMTSIVEATDPRISGTLTMASVIRQFAPQGDPDETFNVAIGNARIDNARGAWVGYLDGLGTQEFAAGRILLSGTGAYEGLTAFMRMEDYDGVIFDHGLPPMPAPIEPPERSAPSPTTPVSPAGRPDPTAPARFAVERTVVSDSDVTWTEADGYREGTVSGVTMTLEATDPRISGTLTMSATGREFGPQDAPDEAFGVMVGTVRIDDAEGAWVGTVDDFWTDDYDEGLIRLEGEGANEGLTAFVRMDEGDGVIFAHGLPLMPDLVEGSTPATEPTPAPTVAPSPPPTPSPKTASTSSATSWSNPLPVPDIIDLREHEAIAALEGVGLAAGAHSEATSETIVASNVIGSDPAAASEVLPDSEVAYVVSTGLPTVMIVPPARDLADTDAVADWKPRIWS